MRGHRRDTAWPHEEVPEFSNDPMGSQAHVASRGFSHLVLEGGGEAVVEHLLVEDGRDAPGHGRDDPDPVPRAAAAHTVLVLHVLHEGLGGRVVVHDGHLGRLLVT